MAACKVPSTQHKEYFEYLKLKHKMGNRPEFKSDPDALFFFSPLKKPNGKSKVVMTHTPLHYTYGVRLYYRYYILPVRDTASTVLLHCTNTLLLAMHEHNVC